MFAPSIRLAEDYPQGLKQNGTPKRAVCKSSLGCRNLLFRVPIGVGRRKCLPFFWQIFHCEDRSDGADGNASPAVNALGRIDVELSHTFMLWLIFAGVDTVHRAHVHAGGVLGADTRFGNHVSHSASPLFRTPAPLRRRSCTFSGSGLRKPWIVVVIRGF